MPDDQPLPAEPSAVIRPPRSAGRPRDRRAHQAILEATREIARNAGYGGVTIEGVARRAGVAKTTIYRWWKGKAALVYEACFGGDPHDSSAPNTGRLSSDLAELVRRDVMRQTAPLARMVLPGLIAEQAESTREAQLFDELLSPERARLARVLQEARVRGELSDGGSPDVLFDLLCGAVFHHCFVMGRAPDAEFEAELTEHLVATAVK